VSPIRTLIVDDHELVREHTAALLSAHSDLEVVSVASNGFEAIRIAEESQPDVVVLDISMPDMNGLQAAPIIKRVAPHTEILFFSQHDSPFFVREAFAIGALGFLTKADAGAHLAEAVRTVHLKRKFLSKNVSGVAALEQVHTKVSASSQ